MYNMKDGACCEKLKPDFSVVLNSNQTADFSEQALIN